MSQMSILRRLCFVFLQFIIITGFVIAGPASASDNCILHFQAYDYYGLDWENTTLTITNGEEILLENWSMSESYYESVEFVFHGDLLELEFSYDSQDGGYIHFYISNDQGHILFGGHDRYYYSSSTETFSYEFTCDDAADPEIEKWTYAKPDLEPACYDGYEDEFNGGCNSAAQVFTTVQCGETVAGTLGRYQKDDLMVFDEDWYLLTLDQDSDIKITCFFEMPAVIDIYRYDSCEELQGVYSNELGTGFAYLRVVPSRAGQYAIRVTGRSHYAIPCGSQLQYFLGFLCDAPPSETTCSTENEEPCAKGIDSAVNDICEYEDDPVSQIKFNCINEGSTGNYWYDGAIVPDNDYYSFHLWEEQEITFLAEAMCPLTMSLFFGHCGDHSIIDSIEIDPYMTGSMHFDSMIPGDYLLLAEPLESAGVYCDSTYKFMFDLDLYGSCINSSDLLYGDYLFEPGRQCHNRGNTHFAVNHYNATDYGCEGSFDYPETVHRISLPERATVSITVEAEGWEPQVVIAENWPPENCRNVEANQSNPNTVFVPRMILNPEIPYFIFIEQESERGGDYEITINRIDPADDQLRVDLDLNMDRFASGDPFILKGTYSNYSLFSSDVLLGLALEIYGEYWIYDRDEEWSRYPEEYPFDHLSANEEVERIFIDSVWPDTTFQNSKGAFTFCLFRYTGDSETILLSNIDIEEFTF